MACATLNEGSLPFPSDLQTLPRNKPLTSHGRRARRGRRMDDSCHGYMPKDKKSVVRFGEHDLNTKYPIYFQLYHLLIQLKQFILRVSSVWISAVTFDTSGTYSFNPLRPLEMLLALLKSGYISPSQTE